MTDNKKLSFIDRYFGITKNNSKISSEIIAGLIVFLSIIYILPTNSGILSNAGMDYEAVFVATALCSAVVTILMGIFAKFPIALSAGMGMNAFIAFTICGSLGYTWGEALTLILISGVIFFIISLTPIRTIIVNAIPNSIKIAISAGLGAFICFVGLTQGGIIIDGSTLVTLGDFSNPTTLLALFGIVLVFMGLCLKGKIRIFAIIIAMLITAMVGVILGLLGVDGMPTFNPKFISFASVGKVFGECFKHFDILAKPETYGLMFSLIFVNLFDTTATLLSVGKDVGIINESGDLIGGKKAMLVDAGGAIICGVIGTSTVTSFAESVIGVQSGGKTGLSATVTGLLFIVALLIYPVFSIFAPINDFSPVTSLALIAVGAMMFGHIKDIDWDDKILVFTTFAIIIFMLLTYSITNGIGIGLILYCLMMISSGKAKKVNIVLYIISIFFLFNFVLNTILDKM